MNDKQEFEPILPPQFGHLEEPLREAQKKISDIDQKIEEIPHDKGPQLRFNPPGYGTPSQGGNRGNRLSQLNQEKDRIKGDFGKKLDQELAGVDPKSAKSIRDTVDIHLGDNAYKAMNKKEIDAEKENPKNIDRSQDIMRIIASNYRADSGKATPAEKKEVKSVPTRDRENKPMSMPGSLTINYRSELNRAEGKESGAPEKAPEKSKGLDLDKE